MPAKTVTAKRKSRTNTKRASRPLPQPDLLRRKVHDLANTLEAASLARQFITATRENAPALEALSVALGKARKALFAMDAGLRASAKQR